MDSEYHIVSELEQSLTFSRRDVPKSLLVKPDVDHLLKNAFTDWAAIAVLWVLAFYLPTWMYPMIAILIASRYHSFGVILHDLTHMPLRSKSIKCRILEILTGYPIGSTINAMRYHHLRHHKDSGMETDPYFKSGIEKSKWIKYLFILRGIILVPFWTFRGIYGTLAFYIIAMRNSYAKVFLQDRSGKDFSQSKEVIQCAAEDRWQLLFHIVLYSSLLWAPKFFIYGYLVPILISGVFAGYRLLNEHKYVETSDRTFETILATTRDNHLSGILKFFLAPKNIGYHIVHHLHPQVAWYKLPQLRKWYVDNYGEMYTNKES
ncbi:fatty acid desaturase family protein [Segetibacter aerophilus]|uniref:Fatty acid desaturase n=1 Tax=Segetibacter aerophilus TaxID=670293 RepID=A0A512BJB1_9BACT|nr:fatty acid desaturase [Segetibacter aerophilus]GEO12052.1 fatty acid desaturase [Segetibacter aerophilus]